MFLIKSKETKRIEYLFNLYKNSLLAGKSKDAAKILLVEDLKMGGKPIRDQFEGFDNVTKIDQINKLFLPLKILDYDVSELIIFLISWEFPGRYNYMPTVEQIRSGKHPLADLEVNVHKIAKEELRGLV